MVNPAAQSTGTSSSGVFGGAGSAIGVCDRTLESPLQRDLTAALSAAPVTQGPNKRTVSITCASPPSGLTIESEPTQGRVEVARITFDSVSSTYELLSFPQSTPGYTVRVSSPSGESWSDGFRTDENQILFNKQGATTAVQIQRSEGRSITDEVVLILPAPVLLRPGAKWRASNTSDDLLAAVAACKPIAFGIAPEPIGDSLTTVGGSVNTDATHLLITPREDHLHVRGASKTCGFTLQRRIFGYSVNEHFKAEGETILLPGDRLWAGSSPILGRDPDIVTPLFPNARNDVDVAQLGQIATENSMYAFLLHKRLGEPDFAVSRTRDADRKITLLRPDVNFFALVSTNPIFTPDVYNFTLRFQGIGQVFIGGRGDVPKREVISANIPYTVYPDEAFIVKIGGGIEKRWFGVPSSPEYEKQRNQMQLSALEAAERHTQRTVDVQLVVSNALTKLLNGDFPSAIFFSHPADQKSAPRPGAVVLPHTTLHEECAVTATCDDNGTFTMSVQDTRTSFGARFRLRRADGSLTEPEEFETGKPQRLAPGDILVLRRLHKDMEITIPPNDRFDARLREAELRCREMAKQSSEPAVSVVASSVGSVAQFGSEKVSLKYLRENGIELVRAFRCGGQKWHLSLPFIMDDAKRIGIFAVVEDEKGKSFRPYYTSLSHAIFRLLPAVNAHGLTFVPQYDKAGDEELLAPCFDVQKQMAGLLNEITRSGRRPKDLSLTPEVWQNAVRINDSYNDWQVYEAAVEINPAACLRRDEFREKPDGDWYAVPDRWMPKYNKPIDTFSLDYCAFGPTALYGGPITYHLFRTGDGQAADLSDGTIEFTFAAAPREVFMPHIGFNPNLKHVRPTSFGLLDRYLAAGPLVLAGRERASAISEAEQPLLEKLPGGAVYWGTGKLLQKNPLVNRFIQKSDAGLLWNRGR